MSYLHIIVIALVQGITEFLPISSSGHLILVPSLTGWPDQGLAIDVSVHMGTLLAVLVYFKEDTKGLCIAACASLGIASAKRASEGTLYQKLFWALVLATLPVVIVGYMAKTSGMLDIMRTIEIIGWASIVFGILLYWVDRSAPISKALDRMALKPALIIGLSQVLALIPGTSRAGITMTSARWLGFSRTEAARFSILLSIPTIAAAGLLGVLDIMKSESSVIVGDALISGALACIAALGAIHFLMKWLTHANMTIFVIYRVLLGVGLLGYLYW